LYNIIPYINQIVWREFAAKYRPKGLEEENTKNL
jgi:hypothetical protein